MVLKAFSFGGGVQSTAALVLAAQGKIDYRTFLFANVGNDSENPETLTYVHEIAMPFAERHEVRLLEVARSGETLYGRITGEEIRGYVIPAYTPTKKGRLDGAPSKRICTSDFKVRVIDKWLMGRGAETQGAIVGLGISRDEIDRVKPNMDKDTIAWKHNAWPHLYDVPNPLDRQACIEVIRSVGLPVPPKSACWFCPHRSLLAWQEMREHQPGQFWQAVGLERYIQVKQRERGLPVVFLNRHLKPLDHLTTDDYTQLSWVEEDVCESGYCFV